MRRIFLALLFVFSCSDIAFAQVVTHRAATASTSNAATYTSGSFTPAAGDLLVSFVVVSGQAARGGSMTDSQTLGWDLITTALKNTSADTVYCFVSRATASASSMTVTFATNNGTATGAIIDVESVSSMLRVGAVAVKQSAIQENQSASTTPAPVFGGAVLTGDVTLGTVGNSTNPATMTPPGGTQCNGGVFTETADVGYATPTTGGEFVSCNSGYTGTTLTWGGTSASAFSDIAIELDTTASPSAPAVPTLVHFYSFPNSQANTLANVVEHLPEASLTNNCLVLRVNYASGSAVAAVTDNQSNTWTGLTKVANGNQTQQIFTSCTGTSTGGVTSVTVTFTTSSPGFIDVIYCEWRNAAGLDGSAGATGSSTSLATGSFSTTNNGDLILQFSEEDGPTLDETWTAGSSPWALQTADTQTLPHSSQSQIQSTHAAINPTMSMNGSDSWNTVAVAIKPSASGTAPAAGMHIVHMMNEALSSSAASPFAIQFPCSGNLIVTQSTNVPGFPFTTITDGTNTYTQISTSFSFSGSGEAQTFHADNATCSSTLAQTWTMSGSAAGGSQVLVYDVSGAATSPFDSTEGRQTASATQSVGGNISGVTFVPTVVNELIFSQIAVSSHNVTGENTGAFDCPVPSAFASTNDPHCENNGFTIQFAGNSTASRQYVWTESGGAVGSWASTAVGFMPPTPSGGTPNQFPRIISEAKTEEKKTTTTDR